jgi:hypothetical protein
MDPIMQLAEEKGFMSLKIVLKPMVQSIKANQQVQSGILAHGHFAKTRL